MIPISLTIEGLYSYKYPQTIDFQTLISNHLFGIFGEVGSGKSSILEAMMFALYGESDRLARGDGRNYNMMNLQSDRLFIDFSCFSGKKSGEEYRFIFEAKRNSKNFDNVKAPIRRILKKNGQQWVPVEGETAESIIGMNAKNFKQTIIIPQGKFKEFIELGSKDRTAMLQELFHLHQFDLQDRTASLQKQNDLALAELEGRLQSYEGYTEEKKSALEGEIKISDA